ncbi:MAG TPA: phosphoribosylaminoimidazolesuccinocarboxamide synthase [Spirochaetota bacterium]|nr:phosphoribosylaminoimidazolesuccinocarboxamide synthase [Spirochaetota bacterium]HOS33123.1 phosphoribosylaminoimidazolesuccinocarboxamide synthase [Spirochaetota bacterium]HOS56380.1 phosphoribosylaminoimidazolesuccinocarboxamide synthase [Spirochaetota bacterium]HPK62696.1 phosphoribosylaminoimidazolesuccinocarboxamide synthase [Spirochaetota bacterium]HQF78722.1 phosphoribosylaminoimidazolesuccinocarboxamide synthase [Spirochaetota bacterium]
MNLNKIIEKQLDWVVKETDYNIGAKYRGKVRDVYDLGDKLLIITTDRISAFDVVLTTIPFKGEILNNLSYFWFEKTKDIIDNHIIELIHPNAVLVKKCRILPIEIIVRGYLTGGGYREYTERGEISGLKLPKGLKKNVKFDKPILTPTTKASEGHDIPISVEEIIKQNIIPKDLMEKIEVTAIKLFEKGQEIVNKNNLILVDTKYEFGLSDNGELIIADEIHTADSSRYWYLDSYSSLFDEGKEQKSLDKEYLRQWLMDNNFKGEGTPPVIPLEIKTEVIKRYITAYNCITGSNYSLENKDSMKLLDQAVLKLKDRNNIK